jgi:ribosomal protein S18 acetylase RimI-like enzyme
LSCVEELWNTYQDEGTDGGYVFLVYRDDDGRAAGYACFGPHPLTQGTYDLYWIAVDPIAQGRGIGHALLMQAESEVQARSGRLLLIETSDTPVYASARRLYETSGYRCEATVHDFYASGDSLLIFAKDLGLIQRRKEALDMSYVMAALSQEPSSQLLGDGGNPAWACAPKHLLV